MANKPDKESAASKLEFITEVNKHRLKFCSMNVPILGAWTGEKYDTFYEAIRYALSNQLKTHFEYSQDDICRFEGETIRQKIHSMLALSRFVIAHDTSPSGEIIELGYCKNVGAITAIIRRKGVKSSSMTMDFDIHSSDFRTFEYEIEDEIKELSLDDLKYFDKFVAKIIAWAEDRRYEREKEFKRLSKRFKYSEEPPLELI